MSYEQGLLEARQQKNAVEETSAKLTEAPCTQTGNLYAQVNKRTEPSLAPSGTTSPSPIIDHDRRSRILSIEKRQKLLLWRVEGTSNYGQDKRP